MKDLGYLTSVWKPYSVPKGANSRHWEECLVVLTSMILKKKSARCSFSHRTDRCTCKYAGIIYYTSGRILWLIFLDMPGGGRTLRRRRQEECQRRMTGAPLWRADFWTWCGWGKNELTAAVATCTRPTQAQSSQHPSIDRRDMLGTPHSLQKSHWWLIAVREGESLSFMFWMCDTS